MCNRYGFQHPNNRLVAEFSDLGPVRWAGAEPNAPRHQIRPTNRAPILRPHLPLWADKPTRRRVGHRR